MFILLKGEGILDTNYSCTYATPHLMRRVCLYLKDNIKTETEEKSEELTEQSGKRAAEAQRPCALKREIMFSVCN